MPAYGKSMSPEKEPGRRCPLGRVLFPHFDYNVVSHCPPKKQYFWNDVEAYTRSIVLDRRVIWPTVAMRTAFLLLIFLCLVTTGQWFGPPPPRHFEFHDGHDSQSVEEETEVIHRKKIKNRHHERHGVHDEFGHPPLPPPIPPPGLPPPHIGLQNLVNNLNAGVQRLLAPLFYGK